MSNRVCITGIGAITPIGNDIEAFEKSLYDGVSGAGEITRFDASGLPTHIACEVKDFSANYRDIKVDFALKASREAISNSGLSTDQIKKANSSLSIGIGLELFSMDDLIDVRFNGKTSNEISFLNFPSDLCAHMISHEFGFNHSPAIHISACAAGTDAIGDAYKKVKSGSLDICLAGGTDSMVNPMGIAGFCRIGAMTTDNENPKTASRPFDKNRNGFVLGEGAAFLVLESETSAIARGAKVLGYIVGHGNSLDAHSVSDPHPEGRGAYDSMKRALDDSGLDISDIDAISVHGTATPKNDPTETYAIKTLLGDKAKTTPVFATKSLVGHCISAAGAIETVTSVIAFKRQELHQTLNLDEVDESCDLCHVREENLKGDFKYILKNSFGFGGQNSSLIIERGPQ
ncbi:MAG: beta-ketoacyl-[acyl-carrier-protein] synthase family protein [Bacteriovoracaceae bacterium]|jgi:3-oxoacyl-[acyl-carrier-protein] synthase II|nr:beta-ketoacyl-[acyl-carrier-protein] synthase family protein [Bacteriovoracaceae bacterium]